MTSKQYAENRLKSINKELEETRKNLDNRSKVYSVAGTLFGLFALFSITSPVVALPMAGIALSWFMNKNFYKKTFGATISRLEKEKNHILNSMKNGVDIRPDSIKKKKGSIDKMKESYSKEEKEYTDASSKMNLTNLVAAGTSFAACLFPGTLLAIAALGTIGLKYLSDSDVSDKKVKIEDSTLKLNNLVDEYNIGAYTIAGRNKTNTSRGTTKRSGNAYQKANSKSSTKTTGATSKPKSAMPFHVGGYSKEEEAAVDAYVRSLENQGSNTKGVQKRKI